MAQTYYDEAARSGIVKPWKFTKDSRGRQVRVLDLHRFSGALSRTVVRSFVEGLFVRPRLIEDDLVIVVGKGIHSETVPVLKSAVLDTLHEEYKIKAYADPSNAGRLIISKRHLEKLVETRGQI